MLNSIPFNAASIDEVHQFQSWFQLLKDKETLYCFSYKTSESDKNLISYIEPMRKSLQDISDKLTKKKNP